MRSLSKFTASMPVKKLENQSVFDEVIKLVGDLRFGPPCTLVYHYGVQ